jgi:hypothetical protein
MYSKEHNEHIPVVRVMIGKGIESPKLRGLEA